MVIVKDIWFLLNQIGKGFVELRKKGEQSSIGPSFFPGYLSIYACDLPTSDG